MEQIIPLEPSQSGLDLKNTFTLAGGETVVVSQFSELKNDHFDHHCMIFLDPSPYHDMRENDSVRVF